MPTRLEHTIERHKVPAAWLRVSVGELERADKHELFGRMSASAAAGSRHASMYVQQLRVWIETLDRLKQIAAELIRSRPATSEWTVLFEYMIPRRMSRIDLVVLTPQVVIPIEIKVGMSELERAALWQVEDYALDLRDYHAESRGRLISPVLVPTDWAGDHVNKAGDVYGVHCCNWTGLAQALLKIADAAPATAPIDHDAWTDSPYRPTPTIVEAARAVFNGNQIADLNHAHAENLSETVSAIEDEVKRARDSGSHTIVFVTGVPGAGKTLAGLSAVQSSRVGALTGGAASFLSGNLPLTKVLKAAIADDAIEQGMNRNDALRRAKDLVEVVHKFVDYYAVRNPDNEPDDHVVIYDEAQRAWNAAAVSRFHKGFDRSEPALLLDIMARKRPWSVVVAVVGGGQEIHTGEAGIAEWGRAILQSAIPWRVVASPEALSGGDAVANQRLFVEPTTNLDVYEDSRLHLRVSTRSPRAQHISKWVNNVLLGDAESAAAEYRLIRGFRMAMTRDLSTTRQWLRDTCRGELRPGLVASSGALRHRAYGLELDSGFHHAYPIEKWFLSGGGDVRSSHQLEVAMREFDVQGLELDYVGLCWGDDLTRSPDGSGWQFRSFRGTTWQAADKPEKKQYLLNKYRVLLTRAREGLIVWVPPGDASDPTRDPAVMDRTAKYLRECGLPMV